MAVRFDKAALGLRAHSGWAVLLAVASAGREPAVLLRRRVELSQQTPRQPFHAAEALPAPEAEAAIRRAERETLRLADAAVRDAVAEMRARGQEPVAAGLLVAGGRPLPGLAEILASHASIHAAEGELFREALRRACRDAGLNLVEVKERELWPRAARALRATPEAIQQRLALWGKQLGAPWTQDQKHAALAAWLALADERSSR